MYRAAGMASPTIVIHSGDHHISTASYCGYFYFFHKMVARARMIIVCNEDHEATRITRQTVITTKYGSVGGSASNFNKNPTSEMLTNRSTSSSC